MVNIGCDVARGRATNLIVLPLVVVSLAVFIATFWDSIGMVRAEEKKSLVTVADDSITVTSSDGKSKLSIVAGKDYVGLWLVKGRRQICLFSGREDDVGPYLGVIREGGRGCEWAVSIDKDGSRLQTVGKAGNGEIDIKEVGK